MSDDPPRGSPTLGRYVFERRIASGGMADVFLARQHGSYGFTKRVALKVLKRDIAADDENVKMFIREALVAAEFRHTNLAQVYEVGEVDGRLFIAMELVRGVSVATLLRELRARGKTLPLEVAVHIAIDVLDGLAHAHEARSHDGKTLGLVHRDISPQNIMTGVDGSVKVVDFGIARAGMAAARETQPRLKGKFNYMPPEQWDARGSLDARADIFALGIVVYEMTTGGLRLFRGETPKDLYKAIVLDPVPDPRTRVSDYPEPLAKIVMRALERGPGARWSSARAMRAALVEFAQSEDWALTTRSIADVVRAALGPGDIEERWDAVAPVPDSTEPRDADAANDANTRATEPAGTFRNDSHHPRRAASVALFPATCAIVGSLVAGVLVGTALGRKTAPHATVRVRVADVVSASTVASLRTAWARAHPDVDLRLDRMSTDDALWALRNDRADIAIVPVSPTSRAPRTLVGLASDHLRVAVVTTGDSRGTSRTFTDWLASEDVANEMHLVR